MRHSNSAKLRIPLNNPCCRKCLDLECSGVFIGWTAVVTLCFWLLSTNAHDFVKKRHELPATAGWLGREWDCSVKVDADCRGDGACTNDHGPQLFGRARQNWGLEVVWYLPLGEDRLLLWTATSDCAPATPPLGRQERNEFRSTAWLANPFAVLVICPLHQNAHVNTRTTDVWQPPR